MTMSAMQSLWRAVRSHWLFPLPLPLLPAAAGMLTEHIRSGTMAGMSGSQNFSLAAVVLFLRSTPEKACHCSRVRTCTIEQCHSDAAGRKAAPSGFPFPTNA